MTEVALPEANLLIQLAVTLYMTGLIWFVQVVQYPLFDRVGEAAFGEYHRAHMQRTGWAVAPPMMVEGLTATLSLVLPPSGVPLWQLWLGLALLAVVWGSTAFLQVPAHGELAEGFSAGAHRRLVATNWIRVAGWSLRAFLLLWWL